jgi:hypothetical protein
MNNEEEHETDRDKKMNCARGLPSSEKTNSPRHGGIESRGHRETAPDHERKKNKDDYQVSDALECIV